MAGEPIFTYTEDFTDRQPPRIGYMIPPGVTYTSLKTYLTFYEPWEYPERHIGEHTLDLTENEYTFTFNAQDRNKLCTLDGMNNSLSGEIDFVLEATDTDGNTWYGVKTRRLDIDTTNAYPTLKSFYVRDENDASYAITGDKSRIIDGLNKACVHAEGSPNKGASIASIEVSYYDQEFKMDDVPENYLGYFDNLTSVNGRIPELTVTVTDSRGLVSTIKQQIPSFILYVPPTLTANVYIDTPEGEGYHLLKTHVEGEILHETWAPGIGINTVHVDYRVDIDGGGFTNWISAPAESIGYSYDPDPYNKDPIKYNSVAKGDITYGLYVGTDETITVEVRAYDIDISQAVYYSQTIRFTPTFDWSKSDFNFNVPVNAPGLSIGHVDMTDFVKEWGTNGDWTYRKWNSGIAECWCVATGSVALDSQFDGFYQKVVTVNYPFTFSEPPTVFVDGGSSAHLDIARTFGARDAARAKFNILGLTAHTAEYSVSVYAIGKI